MRWVRAVAVVCLAVYSLGEGGELRKFPDGFLFGVATASYQIEGAWNVNDKSENIWDRFTHTTDAIADGSTGDIADDSYHLYRRDVEMLRELGVNFYRFSISWSRLLPSGFPNQISEDGKRYYNNLIDELLKYNIQPMVTLFHWDLPQRLQDLGGWTNPLIAQWFEDYARVIYDLYADRVQYWATLNEPGTNCMYGHVRTEFAPGLGQPGYAEYLCAKHSLVAHARAWRLFDTEYRPKYGGINGITNHVLWFDSASDSAADQAATELAREMYYGMFVHAIYTNEGGWPKNLEEAVAKKSQEEGYPRSRLIAFTEEEIELVRGTYDYFGLQYYTSKIAKSAKSDSLTYFYASDIDVEVINDPTLEKTVADIIQVSPSGLRKVLNLIRERYNNPRILITENGYPSLEGRDDDRRVQFYRDHLEQLLDAIYLDGVNVTHYTAWSLMDNFEWGSGYSLRFGLYEVDYASAERTRRPRKSAAVYKEVLRTRTVDHAYEPASFDLSVDV